MEIYEWLGKLATAGVIVLCAIVLGVVIEHTLETITRRIEYALERVREEIETGLGGVREEMAKAATGLGG